MSLRSSRPRSSRPRSSRWRSSRSRSSCPRAGDEDLEQLGHARPARVWLDGQAAVDRRLDPGADLGARRRAPQRAAEQVGGQLGQRLPLPRVAEAVVGERQPEEGQGLSLAEARMRLLLGVFVLVCGGSLLLIVALTMDLTPERAPEQSTLFSALLATLALLGLPLAYHRFRHPRQRLLLHLCLIQLFAGLLLRLACWRAGLPMSAIWVGETVLYASLYSCGAAAVRTPWVLLTLPILLVPLLLVVEFGVRPDILALAWIVSVPIGLHYIQRSR